MAKSTSLKVLAIGNSLSADAMYWLYDIARGSGIGQITLGNLYIGGCSLETHWANAVGNNALYEYYKNDRGAWEVYPDKTLLHGITDEAWDVITLQQASALSGVWTSYEPYLSNLIDYVNLHKTNVNAKLAWHMTWAYQSDSDHGGFAAYNNSQAMMYGAIVETIQKNILTNPKLSFIIPAGAAIQNARASFIGDTLTCDGVHLTHTLGRYIAGASWFHALTGLPIDSSAFCPPDPDSTAEHLRIAEDAVRAAAESPFPVLK